MTTATFHFILEHAVKILVIKLATVITANYSVMMFPITGINNCAARNTIHFLIFRVVVDRREAEVGHRVARAGKVVGVGCGGMGVEGTINKGNMAVVVHCS